MKQKRDNAHYYNNNLSFIDMLFNILIGFVMLFFMSFLLITENQKSKADIEAKADIIITMSWPDGSPHDVDLWALTPDGDFVGYPHRDGNYIYLDRDDLGYMNNFIEIDGKKVPILPRREVISIRGKKPGRYVINCQLYARHVPGDMSLNPTEADKAPIPVKVEITQINPSYKIIEHRELILTKPKEEQTAFSFTIDEKGNITDISEDQIPFIAGYNHHVEQGAMNGGTGG